MPALQICNISEETWFCLKKSVFDEVFPGSVLCSETYLSVSIYFSSSLPSLMLLIEADAPLGEFGGEGRALYQRAGGDGGEGERRGDSSRGGLLQGDSLGDRA
ncbi:hypothetical protein ATANTOWER_020852 [Ataeniobius toweri]|uniref:Uncharacterized protein n=1 Tax=Ataeniobius toweri TaxID=208326 RepID=A0ABU7BTR8_9TELE|nr:hypothetical protein [Ataeniobius toweri]